MPVTIDPANASIDGVIQWLRNQRQLNPHVPLSELVSVSTISQSRLTDMACIDLIERKRLGHATTVEDLLREVPILASSDAARLDLIDAELCVQMELDQTIDLADYAKRFPDLARSIEALAQLDRRVPAEPLPSLSGSVAASSSLAPFRANTPAASHSRRSSESRMIDALVQPPPWFTREQVQASSDRSCLIRGRDSNQNRAVALKVIRLASAIRKDEIDAQLALVEAASMVRHPAWVTPDVAAVENQTLAVIRPWIFGTRWDQARRLANPPTRLRDLARVGYALQSAHDTANNSVPAAHGGIHLNNLLVNADGDIQIVDAGVCIQPAAGEMLGSLAVQSDGLGSTHQRRQSDIRSLCALLRVVTGGGSSSDTDFRRQSTMLDQLCQKHVAEPNKANACADLADAAMKLADGNLGDSNPNSKQRQKQKQKPLATIAKSYWWRLVQRARATND